VVTRSATRLSPGRLRRVEILLGAITVSMSLARGILSLENHSSPLFDVLSGLVLLVGIVYFLSVRRRVHGHRVAAKTRTRQRLSWRRAVAISLTALASVLLAAAGFVALVRRDVAVAAALLLPSVGGLVFLWRVRWPDELDPHTAPSNRPA